MPKRGKNIGREYKPHIVGVGVNKSRWSKYQFPIVLLTMCLVIIWVIAIIVSGNRKAIENAPFYVITAMAQERGARPGYAGESFLIEKLQQGYKVIWTTNRGAIRYTSVWQDGRFVSDNVEVLEGQQ